MLSPAAVLINSSGSVQQVAPASSTHYAVPYTVGSTQLLPVNPLRAGFTIFNDCSDSIYVRLGPSASADVWTFRVNSAAFYDPPFPPWTGIVTVWCPNNNPVASGTIHIEEFTP